MKSKVSKMEKTNFLNELFNVEDKIALVTGGGSGIGKIIAEALAFSGSKVYITSRKLEIIKNTSEEINSKKPKHHVDYFCSDLSSESGIAELVNSFQKKEGRKARSIIEDSRSSIEDILDIGDGSLIFTSFT